RVRHPLTWAIEERHGLGHLEDTWPTPSCHPRRVRSVTQGGDRTAGTGPESAGRRPDDGMNRPAERFELGTRGPSPNARQTRPREGCDGMQDDRFGGAAVGTLPRPNRTYSAGRVCAAPGCGTKLSMYNKWQYCWQHEPIHAYIPRGKRKSKKRAA